MTVVYGSTLLITIILDSYWTIDIYHYAKEGLALSRKQHMTIVAQTSLNTSNLDNT
jgi:hypothetical protein